MPPCKNIPNNNCFLKGTVTKFQSPVFFYEDGAESSVIGEIVQFVDAIACCACIIDR